MQLLSTKMQIPPGRAAQIARDDLLKRLDDALATGIGLFLISAPAGYGKTTLLAGWLAHLCGAGQGDMPQRSVRAAWLALDSGDNDPACFLSYLGAALGRGNPAVAQRFLHAVENAQHHDWEPTLAMFINEIAAQADPVLLVLDDYHHIVAESIHNLVAGLLEFQPPNLHLAIVTRADPPLPLARWRGRGQMIELRQGDLRFTSDEAATFLARTLPQQLTREQVVALNARTEGWIAGLQMAALSLLGRADVTAFIDAFAGSHRHILDYLSEEVYRNQPVHVRRFLLRTSILERFDAQLCAALLAPEAPDAAVSDAQQALEYLEHANLFVVPLDDERRWYRYHHLFADLLRLRLAQELPETVSALHERASTWFEERHLLRDAIHHALAARQYERAAELMERAAEVTMMSCEVATLRAWLEALPEPVLHSRPLLCVYMAGALLLTGACPDEVESLLRDSLQGGQDTIGGPIVVHQALMAAYRGSDATSRRLAQRALQLLPEHSPFFRSFATLILALGNLGSGDDDMAVAQLQEVQHLSDQTGNVLNSVLARCHLAELAMVRNRLDEAESLFRQALALADQHPHADALSSFPLIGLGTLHYERNELEQAQHYLERGVALSHVWGPMGGMNGRVVLTRVHQALGLPDASATKTAVDAGADLVHGHIDVMGRYILLNQVHAALQTDDAAIAAPYACSIGLDDMQAALPAPSSLVQCQEGIVRAQLLRAQGDARGALRTLDAVQQSAAQHGRERIVLQALLERALVHQQIGHSAAAVDALQAALEIGARAGLVRIFVDCGAPMAALLRLALRRQVAATYVSALLAAFQSVASAAPHATDTELRTDTALSARELEVLDLVARGMTNWEIAVHLSIAVCTVKTHINHICQKLDAPNRTAAVNAARQLQLLPP